MREFIINESENGLTLEKYAFKVLKTAPMSFVYKLFRKKDIKVNGHHQDKKYRLSTNDVVAIYINEQQFEEFLKEKELTPNTKIKDDRLVVDVFFKPKSVVRAVLRYF